MGSLFSKSEKVKPTDPRKVSSAPATLENLDGTAPQKGGITLSPDTSPSMAAIKEKNIGRKGDSMKTSQSFNKQSDAVRSPSTPDLLPRPTVHVPDCDGANDVTSPSGKRTPKKIDVIGEQTDGQKLAAALPTKVAIPEDAQMWSQVYGESLIRNFSSSDWKEREHSLSMIQRSLGSSKFLSGKDPKMVYSATAEMLAKTLKDKVAPIFHASLDLLSELLASFSSMLPKQQLHLGMDPIMPIIVHRCGNLNTRIHESSLQAILAVAKFPNFGSSYVGPFVLAEPPKRNRDASQAAQMFGRLDLLHGLLSTFHSSEGLPIPDMMKISKQGLENADDKVRQAAIKVVVEVYKVQKASNVDVDVERHLGVVKPALLQVLHKKFEEADNEMASGKSTTEFPAIATGIKVYGSALPPLPQASGMRMEGSALKPVVEPPWRKPRSDGISGGLTSAPRSGASPGPRERQRMNTSGEGQLPGTPPTPPLGRSHSRSKLSPLPVGSNGDLAALEVPKYSKMLSQNSHKGSSALGLDSPQMVSGQRAGTLDDAEEQLIQYIMTDDKVMGA